MSEEDIGKTEDGEAPGGIKDPPQTIGGIIRHLGPGLIIAGSIVGSGELIATTIVGAKAGFLLLWIILIGCVIKVLTQVEMGRYTISSGKTSLSAMAEVPGPRIKGRGNWLTLYWFLMFIFSIGQLGGIVGGVGQALMISVPITAEGRSYNEILDAEMKIKVKLRELHMELKKKVEILPVDPEALKGLRENIKKALDEDLAQSEQDSSRENVKNLLNELTGQESWIQEGLAWQTIFAVMNSDLDQSEKPDQPGKGDYLRAQALSFVTSNESPLEKIDSERVRKLRGGLAELAPNLKRQKPKAHDSYIWAAIIAIGTAGILYAGRYGFIQLFSTLMVFSFTIITVINLFVLQKSGIWAVSGGEFLDGLKFQLPPAQPGSDKTPLLIALAAFGIIGVGASELVAYPYWCIEKGYARFTGQRDDSDAWAERARGWMRVMRWDAWCSMVVYTFATVAFYLLGAAILHRTGLNPGGPELVRTLGVMYEPVFGQWAQAVFLFGAIAVLYSTFFVANAGHSRVFTDALKVTGLGIENEKARLRSVKIFSIVFPMLCLGVYILFPDPVKLIIISGIMQGIMLPMLAGAALWFRYRRSDKRILPGSAWDFFLWLSALGMLISGAVTIYQKLF